MRVLLVEDHPVYVGGLLALLATEPDIAVVGTATTADAAEELARQHTPDLVLMDLRLKDQSGIDATYRVLQVSPHSAVLVLSMLDDDASISAAIRAGAHGYLLKDADDEEILTAIRSVASGGAVFGRSVAPRLRMLPALPNSKTARAELSTQLTEREAEILNLVATGLSNADITDRLVLSRKTVRNHIYNIMTKLGTNSRAQLIITARSAGMGQEP